MSQEPGKGYRLLVEGDLIHDKVEIYWDEPNWSKVPTWLYGVQLKPEHPEMREPIKASSPFQGDPPKGADTGSYNRTYHSILPTIFGLAKGAGYMLDMHLTEGWDIRLPGLLSTLRQIQALADEAIATDSALLCDAPAEPPKSPSLPLGAVEGREPREWRIMGMGQHGIPYIQSGPKPDLNEDVLVREILGGGASLRTRGEV